MRYLEKLRFYTRLKAQRGAAPDKTRDASQFRPYEIVDYYLDEEEETPQGRGVILYRLEQPPVLQVVCRNTKNDTIDDVYNEIDDQGNLEFPMRKPGPLSAFETCQIVQMAIDFLKKSTSSIPDDEIPQVKKDAIEHFRAMLNSLKDEQRK